MTQPFEFPSSVEVAPPRVPSLAMAPPMGGNTLVLPVVGPPGPQGPPGDTVDVLAYGPVSVTNQALVQINHRLIFQPAGIICIDNNGVVTDFGAIAYPMQGTCEITFGFPFSGTIYLS